jgi:Ca-activated chloride channel family protein
MKNNDHSNWTDEVQASNKQSRRDPGMLLLFVYLLILFFILLIGKIAFATPEENKTLASINNWSDIRQGTLMVPTQGKEKQYHSALLLSTEVDITINGMIARTIVRQTFSNDSSEWIEGVYVFPLPDESAVDHLRMKIGHRIIVGEIKEKKKALQIYNEAKKQGRKATLLEQERPNVFTTSVANIAPGEIVDVEIEYQQLVQHVDGIFSIRFPMVIGTRYIPGDPTSTNASSSLNISGSGWATNTDQVTDASRITPPVSHPSKGKINPVKLRVNLSPGFQVDRVKSLYHGVTSEKNEDGAFLIQFNNLVWADRDFVLEWTPSNQEKIQAALFSEIHKEKAHYLLMVMPPAEQLNSTVLPRELIFVLDTSGSMGGESLRQAKEALKLAISRMTSQDRFNVIEFNSTADKLFDAPKPVSPATLSKATSYIDSLEARGGTEISSALKMALNGKSKNHRIRQVIFLTDGCVGNEDDLFALISRRIGDTRLFTVGIGSAPNSFFMKRSAQIGRGTFTYIGKVSEIHEKMANLFQKLENSIFTNVELLADGEPVTGYPTPIPDLYLGEPLIFSTQLNDIPENFTLRGMVGVKPWSVTLQGKARVSSDGIATHWARQKIRYLMDSLSLGADSEQIRPEIIDIALENHLVSRYTSLVAVEKQISRVDSQSLRKAPVSTNLPAGWDYNKVFGGTARTATASTMFLLMGIIALTISALVYLSHRIRHQS